MENFVDLKEVNLLDLSQDWGMHTPAFATYEGPTIKWIKRVAFDRVGGQHISSTLHVGTHLDAPLHFITNGQDVSQIPLNKLFGEAVIVDLSQFNIGDYDIYTPEHFELWEKKYGIKIEPGHILIIHTGYHKYYPGNWYGESIPDETKYFIKHPGPTAEFTEYVLEKKISWMAIDAGSTDHPMNTVIRKVRPDLAKEAEKKLGKSLEEIFPEKDYQTTHYGLFKHGVFHLENIGGEIDKILNQKVYIGCFPWRFVGGEAAFCRLVAFVR